MTVSLAKVTLFSICLIVPIIFQSCKTHTSSSNVRQQGESASGASGHLIDLYPYQNGLSDVPPSSDGESDSPPSEDGEIWAEFKVKVGEAELERKLDFDEFYDNVILKSEFPDEGSWPAMPRKYLGYRQTDGRLVTLGNKKKLSFQVAAFGGEYTIGAEVLREAQQGASTLLMMSKSGSHDPFELRTFAYVNSDGLVQEKTEPEWTYVFRPKDIELVRQKFIDLDFQINRTQVNKEDLRRFSEKYDDDKYKLRSLDDAMWHLHSTTSKLPRYYIWKGFQPEERQQFFKSLFIDKNQKQKFVFLCSTFLYGFEGKKTTETTYKLDATLGMSGAREILGRAIGASFSAAAEIVGSAVDREAQFSYERSDSKILSIYSPIKTDPTTFGYKEFQSKCKTWNETSPLKYIFDNFVDSVLAEYVEGNVDLEGESEVDLPVAKKYMTYVIELNNWAIDELALGKDSCLEANQRELAEKYVSDFERYLEERKSKYRDVRINKKYGLDIKLLSNEKDSASFEKEYNDCDKKADLISKVNKELIENVEASRTQRLLTQTKSALERALTEPNYFFFGDHGITTCDAKPNRNNTINPQGREYDPVSNQCDQFKENYFDNLPNATSLTRPVQKEISEFIKEVRGGGIDSVKLPIPPGGLTSVQRDQARSVCVSDPIRDNGAKGVCAVRSGIWQACPMHIDDRGALTTRHRKKIGSSEVDASFFPRVFNPASVLSDTIRSSDGRRVNCIGPNRLIHPECRVYKLRSCELYNLAYSEYPAILDSRSGSVGLGYDFTEDMNGLTQMVADYYQQGNNADKLINECLDNYESEKILRIKANEVPLEEYIDDIVSCVINNPCERQAQVTLINPESQCLSGLQCRIVSRAWDLDYERYFNPTRFNQLLNNIRSFATGANQELMIKDQVSKQQFLMSVCVPPDYREDDGLGVEWSLYDYLSEKYK